LHKNGDIFRKREVFGMNVGEYLESKEIYGNKLRLSSQAAEFFGVDADDVASPKVSVEPVSVAVEEVQKGRLIFGGQEVNPDEYFGQNPGLGRGLNIAVNSL
jgi:hypothetical protein